MFEAALRITLKDLRLYLLRGGGLVQALLLGLLLIFVFSLAQGSEAPLGPQAAAAIFWMASTFCMVLVFNALYSLEEVNGQRQALLLTPAPVQSIWLGKAIAGLVMIVLAQLLFLPAIVVFLGRSITSNPLQGLAIVALTDLGLAAVGSLLGAIAQGQAARESLLSIVVFPLLIPLLLAGIRLGSECFGAAVGLNSASWFGIAGAFDAMFISAGLVLFGFLYGGEE